MVDVIQRYGLWVVLAAVFVAMYWFGETICGRTHSPRRDDTAQVETAAIPTIWFTLGFLRKLFHLKIGR